MTTALSFTSKPPATTESRRSVLVVDDEPEIVDLLRELLQAAGYQVLVAMSGMEGIRLYAERHPSAVLLDIRLPDIDGVRALKEIRRRDPLGRVAILTALGQSDLIRQAMAAGAADYLLKPLDVPRVLDTVADLCA
jgi:DNA-binding NtrC family response regulator